jgi:hypothetical protein
MPSTLANRLEQPASMQPAICHYQHVPVGWNTALQVLEQYFRGCHEPFSCPLTTFHATGMAQLRSVTLIDKMVQRSLNVVASSTSTICHFPCSHKRTIQRNKDAKQEVTSSSWHFFPLLCFA